MKNNSFAARHFEGSNKAIFRTVLSVRDGNIIGYIVNPCFGGPVTFTGLGEMILKIDDMCEAMHFPMADTERTLLKEGRVRRLPVLENNTDDSWKQCNPYEWQRHSTSPVPAASGPYETFLIHVMFRQHSSMQGLFVHVAKKCENVRFRSALELLRMIDSCFAQSEINQSKGITEKCKKCASSG